MMDRRILPVVGKEGYFVGDDGSVWTTWGKGPGAKADRPMRKMSVRMDHEGYRRVTFRDRTSVKVGVLVLTAFVGPCPDGLECCHGPNNDPADDRLCNLRWDAHKENIEDKRRNGTMAVSKGHGRAKLDDEQIRDILALRGQDTQVSVARRFGVSRGYVGQLWSGARKRVTVHG